MPTLKRADVPPLFSWVRVRQSPTARPVLAFSYIDAMAGPSAKGRFVRDESDPAQVARVLNEPDETFRLPGYAFEVVGAEECRALGLPPFPAWYSEFCDDGTAALFLDAERFEERRVSEGMFLKADPAARAPRVTVCGVGPDAGPAGPDSPTSSPWSRLFRWGGKRATPAADPSPGSPARHPIDTAGLAATAARGRLLARLDRVAAGATDAVTALRPPNGLPGFYIAYRGAERWRVAFGQLSEDEATFRTAFEAESASPYGWPFDVFVFDPPRDETGWLRDAARAIAISGRQPVFASDADAYNYLVVPEPDGTNSVYWYPASRDEGVEVMGADCRISVAADDTASVERYHKSLLVSEPGAALLAHTHLLVHDPVPLDVAYVLMRRRPSPMIIVSQHWTYFITHEGSIIPLDLDGTVEIDDELVAAVEDRLAGLREASP